VLGAVVVVWQLVKVVIHLDGIKLTNVSDVIGALFQPLQSGDPGQPNPPALGVLLINASLYTLREATAGFVLGSALGFALAVIFAHSRLLERGLMPFVVASQMVPILAIAPMVVIWLGPTAENIGVEWAPVAVIAAYLTFFPVTINTLRGLLSVPATAVELMQSYAATRREILFKLRVPHALPYIFTALKVSATASVVGTIIGELPSGIQHGLGSDILNFSQYYASGPARLWATNLAAALCGILAFVVVALAERWIVRWTPSETQ
jgi:NitT/TauT family transport system permease protein